MSEVYANGTTPSQTDPTRVIEVKILNALNGGAGGGGGGGAAQVFAGNYAGASPAAFVTPTTTSAIAFDTSNGTQWNFYNGVWN